MTYIRDQNEPFWNIFEARRVLRRIEGCQRRDRWRENWPRIEAEREAIKSGKLVRFEPRPYRRWSLERILARIDELEAMDVRGEAALEAVADILDLEAELIKRGLL